MNVTITLGPNAEKRILGIPEEEVSLVLSELLEKALEDAYRLTNPIGAEGSLPVQSSSISIGNNDGIIEKLNLITDLLNNSSISTSGIPQIMNNIVTQQKVLDAPFGKQSNAEIITTSIEESDEIDVDDMDLMGLIK